ncbi:MAG: sulfite reductase (NADPH) flavoprotein alpha-component [Verrucomicrobiales bacterium]|jgi:sulfite reductase (NADPH) flavoprotein alpha-component
MSQVPVIPDSAPFSLEQRSWLNGFLAGLIGHGEAAPDAGGEAPSPAEPVLFLYGSQSGTAESLAKQYHKQATAKGFASRVSGMDELEAASLPNEKNVLIITSTWGEGEMPDNAADFWDALNQNGSSPALAGLNYSVLALGDMNYADTFCYAGKMLDQRFEELGARRVHARIDCDVDYDEPAEQWKEGVFTALLSSSNSAAKVATPQVALEPESAGYSRKNPFPAPLLVNQKLTASESAKDTRHFAFSIEGSDLLYEAGDALAVYPQNCPEVVNTILDTKGLAADVEVATPTGQSLPLRDALINYYEIRSLLEDKESTTLSPAEFVDGLRKLQPRLYSIASSPKAHPGEVHLCVDVVRYTQNGTPHKGVASTFMAERLPIGATTGVYFQPAKHFRPPVNPDTPMIMVGPGTGIAPFRAFLEERESIAAPGRNWLFFGAQHRASDFIYEDQLTAWVETGHLARLDLAFSRDQEEKLYVQHLMQQNAGEIWSWLEDGAHFYVCGDASRMAKDVDRALHLIIESEGQRSADAAADYVAEMKKSKRYGRDVY